MPENTVTEHRGRNKYGHRSHDRSRGARWISPVRIVIGNTKDLNDWGRARLGNRLRRREAVKRELERTLLGSRSSQDVILNH